MGIIFKPIIGVAINGLALYLLTLLIDGVTYTGGFKVFLLAGIVLGFINFFIKPVMRVLTIPAFILLGGFVVIAINIGILWFLSYFFSVIEFRDVTLTFQNFSTYVIGAIVFGIINWTLSLIK